MGKNTVPSIPKGIMFSFDWPIQPRQLLELYQQTPWANYRTLNQSALILENSTYVLGAWDRKAVHNGQLVGFYRCLTDKTSRGFLEDLIVDEAYRGRGIGSRLVYLMLKKLMDVQILYHNTDNPLVVQMYEKRGFHEITHLVCQERRAY